MDIQVLRNYIEIIESGSITAAAKRLYIAQPALSLQLKSLEKELGTVLLIRSAHRMELTDAGLMLYKKAKSIVSLENSVKKDIRDSELGVKGTLHIAVNPCDAYTLCGGMLSEFGRNHPSVRCELHEANSFEALSMLDSGTADIALVRTPCVLSPDMSAVRYGTDRMAVIYNSESFGIDGKGEIALAQLTGRPLAVIRRCEKTIAAAFSAGTENIRRADKKQRPSLEIAFAAAEISTVVNLAASGLAIGIVPLSAAKISGDTVFRTLSDPAFDTEKLIVTRRNASQSSAEKQFCDMLAAAANN